MSQTLANGAPSPTQTPAPRAFIFDMDGVLLDNEPYWEDAKKQIVTDLFGAENVHQLGSTSGLSIDAIYDRVQGLGLTTSRDAMHDAFHVHGSDIYRNAPITPGLDKLGKFLVDNGFKIGVVSASPQAWIDIVVDRLPIKDHVDFSLSLDKHPELRHKPFPDGHLYGISQLGAAASESVILEDSNSGIAAAKASGAYTIGFKENLLPGYPQTGADVYAANISEVTDIVRSLIK